MDKIFLQIEPKKHRRQQEWIRWFFLWGKIINYVKTVSLAANGMIRATCRIS